MKVFINVPIEKIYPSEGVYTFREELREVNVKYIERTRANRKRTAFYYMVHYERAEDEIYAHNDSRYENLAKANINRKLNKFNPKNFIFEDDICKIG